MKAINTFWTVFVQALGFDEAVFLSTETLPGITLVMVVMAGVAEAVGQSVLLFINRVKPNRFLVSLLINALLFVFTYLFWVLSVGLIARFAFSVDLTYIGVARVLGLGYAPRLLSFLAFLPVLGVPLSALFNIWSFLLIVFGLSAAFGLVAWQALVCAVLGGLLLLVLQRTLGRPLLALARLMRRSAAGVDLVTDPEEVRLLVANSAEDGWIVKDADTP